VDSWITYLQRGLSHSLPKDRIASPAGYSDIKTNLKNLKPFIGRHWRKGVLGGLLILFNSLCGFPQPLISRYLIDRVILDRQLQLLAFAVVLLFSIVLIEKLTGLLQQFYFARFEQEVILDIQENLFNHVLRLPKAFFDSKETGYLMSRLSSDVHGLRWFFSSTIIHIFTNLIRFIGGLVFLFYLEWKLAILVLIVLPGLGVSVRYFSGKNAYPQPSEYGATGQCLKLFTGVLIFGFFNQGFLIRVSDVKPPDE